MISNSTETTTKSNEKRLFSRRNVLKLLLCLPPAAVVTYITTKAGIYIPEYKEDEKQIPFPKHGWLETSVGERPAFISDDEGHAEFLMHMVTTNPVLIKAFSKAHEDFRDSEPENLATILQKNIDHAATFLEEEFGTAFTSLEKNEQLQHQLHVAIYSTSSLISPYLDMDMVTTLNEANGFKLKSAWKYDFPWNKMPTVYPTDDSNCSDTEVDIIHRCKGHDRSIHLMQHLFISYIYIYSTRAKTQDVYRIPNAIRAVLKIIPGIYKKAQSLSYLAGRGWEWIETFEQEITEKKEESVVPIGALDPLVTLDYLANEIGSTTGIKLYQLIFIENQTDLTKFFDKLSIEIETVQKV